MKALGNKESSFAQSPPSQAQAVADARSLTQLTETELAMVAAAGSKPGGDTGDPPPIRPPVKPK